VSLRITVKRITGIFAAFGTQKLADVSTNALLFYVGIRGMDLKSWGLTTALISYISLATILASFGIQVISPSCFDHRRVTGGQVFSLFKASFYVALIIALIAFFSSFWFVSGLTAFARLLMVPIIISASIYPSWTFGFKIYSFSLVAAFVFARLLSIGIFVLLLSRDQSYFAYLVSAAICSVLLSLAVVFVLNRLKTRERDDCSLEPYNNKEWGLLTNAIFKKGAVFTLFSILASIPQQLAPIILSNYSPLLAAVFSIGDYVRRLIQVFLLQVVQSLSSIFNGKYRAFSAVVLSLMACIFLAALLSSIVYVKSDSIAWFLLARDPAGNSLLTAQEVIKWLAFIPVANIPLLFLVIVMGGCSPKRLSMCLGLSFVIVYIASYQLLRGLSLPPLEALVASLWAAEICLMPPSLFFIFRLKRRYENSLVIFGNRALSS
jgi:hypothetical protein